MKRTRQTAAVLLAVALGISGGCTSIAAASEETQSIVKQFNEPGQASKGMMRYWLPDAGVTYEQLEKEMTDLYNAGFGGVEVTLFSSQVAYDNSTYGFGTENWREVMKNVLKIASGFENGFRVDFTLTPCWPVAINTIDPNDTAAEQELVTAYQKVTATSGTVDIPMAPIATADIAGNPFIIQNRLAGTVLARVTSIKEDGTLVLDENSLQVLTGNPSDKTTVAGIPDVSQLAADSDEYNYVLNLYGGEAPDTTAFFKDSAGNPIDFRQPLADIQNYWTTDLEAIDFGDYTPSEGEEISVGDYDLYGFYNRGNGGTTSDYSAFWSVIGSIFQDGMPGVAYWTNLMNQDAVDALTAYLDEQLFCDEELVTLIQQAASTTGISFFEDSLENNYPDGIAWTEDYARYFNEDNGYDPIAYLPFLTGSAVSSADNEAQYHTDYNDTISHMYQDNHVAPLKKYFNDKFGGTYRAQAYFTNDGFVLDLSATSAQVDMADVESLAFGTNFDNYRLVSAGVHLADKQYISDEAFAIQEGIVYNLTWKRPHWQTNGLAGMPL